MDDRKICKQLRRAFNIPALALFIYFILMNALVSAAILAEVLFATLSNRGMTLEIALVKAAQNGWGYILATIVGAVIMLLWKKPQFCFREIWKKKSSMEFSAFCPLLCIFVSAQALFQILAMGMEWVLNLFDLSILKSMEMASFTADSISMLLYVALFAPVFEEILFRGLILRTLEPYGKKFAILASAFLFGIFHGNPVQSPYAFAVGLVLGYVTVEYSLLWAVALHVINNFVLGDVLPRLMQLLPDWTGELIWFVLIWGSAIAALVILLINRRKIADYFRSGKIHPICIKSFFTSPGVLVMTGLMAVSMVMMLLLQ